MWWSTSIRFLIILPRGQWVKRLMVKHYHELSNHRENFLLIESPFSSIVGHDKLFLQPCSEMLKKFKQFLKNANWSSSNFSPMNFTLASLTSKAITKYTAPVLKIASAKILYDANREETQLTLWPQTWLVCKFFREVMRMGKNNYQLGDMVLCYNMELSGPANKERYCIRRIDFWVLGVKGLQLDTKAVS